MTTFTFGNDDFRGDLEREIDGVVSDIIEQANNIVATSADDHIQQLRSLGIELDFQDEELIRREYEKQGN